MALTFYDAMILSVVLGVFFGVLLGVKFLVKIERHQKATLQKILKIEELIIGAEKRILAKLSKKG